MSVGLAAAAPARSGAAALVDALVGAGTRHVFGNPGSTELAILDEIGARNELEYVLCLHEVIAVGAAEGYARVTRRPAVVQLHTTAGLGNAMGMLVNAHVGATPMVVVVGAPARAAAHTEPLLGGDPVSLAAPATKWSWELRTADEIPVVLARAFKVASTPPAGPVVVVAPSDVMHESCEAVALTPSWVASDTRPDPSAIRDAARILIAADAPALVIGDAVRGDGDAVVAVAELLGAPIYSSYLTEAVLPLRHPLDAGPLALFDGDAAIAALSVHDTVLVVGAPFPRVAAMPRRRLAATVIQIGADPWELGKNVPCTAILADERAALWELAHELARGVGTRRTPASRAVSADPHTAVDGVLQQLASVMPGDALLIDESVSAMSAVARQLPRAPGSWLRSRGGALGAGLSMSIGAALAEPGRPVVSVVGDGAAMYAIQALWTAAHHALATTFVILDNGGYRILEPSEARHSGRRSWATEIRRPSIDFASLARSMGVAGHCTSICADLAADAREALANPPSLIHVLLEENKKGSDVNR